MTAGQAKHEADVGRANATRLNRLNQRLTTRQLSTYKGATDDQLDSRTARAGTRERQSGAGRFAARPAQGGRGRAGPGGLLLRLQGHEGQVRGQGRDHRHRRRRLPGDDPLAQPRRTSTSSGSATSARRSKSGPSRSSRTTRTTAPPTSRSSSSTPPRKRCTPTPTSRWS